MRLRSFPRERVFRRNRNFRFRNSSDFDAKKFGVRKSPICVQGPERVSDAVCDDRRPTNVVDELVVDKKSTNFVDVDGRRHRERQVDAFSAGDQIQVNWSRKSGDLVALTAEQQPLVVEPRGRIFRVSESSILWRKNRLLQS